MIYGAKQRLAPVFAVEQHAITRTSRRDLGGGFDGEQFEVADPLAWAPRGVGDLLELRAMVDRAGHDRGGAGSGPAPPGGCDYPPPPGRAPGGGSRARGSG